MLKKNVLKPNQTSVTRHGSRYIIRVSFQLLCHNIYVRIYFRCSCCLRGVVSLSLRSRPAAKCEKSLPRKGFSSRHTRLRVLRKAGFRRWGRRSSKRSRKVHSDPTCAVIIYENLNITILYNCATSIDI